MHLPTKARARFPEKLFDKSRGTNVSHDRVTGMKILVRDHGKSVYWLGK